MRWRGWVEAAGLWFAPRPGDDSQRLAAAWTEGSRLLRACQGSLLLFPEPRRLEVERTSALAVLAVESGWASFPSARPAPGEILVMWGGEVRSARLAELPGLDLGALWDSSELDFRSGAPLSAPLARPRRVAATKESLRDVFGTAVPEPAPEQQAWLRRLREPSSPPSGSSGLLGFFDLLRSVFGVPENQRYLSKMLDLFDKQRWDEALRHAIPLDTSSLPGGVLERFLGQLKPRKGLDFTAKTSTGQAGLSTSLEGVELLRSVYHRAFQALLQAGRIDEAAFVKGELLDDARGAVELLEQHRRFETAARLALLKGLPAELQVRLLFQAGKVEQALTLARRAMVYAQALALLQPRDGEKAREFRKEWARDLSRFGQIGEALTIGWEVRDMLPEYPTWVERALAEDGASACQALALGLEDDVLCRRFGMPELLRRWFADPSFTTLERRRTLLRLLAEKPRRSSLPEIQNWARHTARQVMRQANCPFPLGDQKVLDMLIELSADPWLRVDRPRSLPRQQAKLDQWRERAGQKGQLPIYDAASLGDGRCLLALGHAGLMVVSAGGRVSQRFATPAHQLVVPRYGDLYLAVSQGRVSAFRQGRVTAWCLAEIDGFAESHGGFDWFVWRDRELFRIDLAPLLEGRSDWEAIDAFGWTAPPRKLVLGSRSLAVLFQEQVTFHHHHLLMVHSRKRLAGEGPFLLTSQACEPLRVWEGVYGFRGVTLGGEGELVALDFQEPYGVAVFAQEKSLTLCLFDITRPRQQLVLELPEARFARVRVRGQHALVCDSVGRLLQLDLSERQWLAQMTF